jgi:hypothetical protein
MIGRYQTNSQEVALSCALTSVSFAAGLTYEDSERRRKMGTIKNILVCLKGGGCRASKPGKQLAKNQEGRMEGRMEGWTGR